MNVCRKLQPGTFQPRPHAGHAALAAEAEGASDAQGGAGAPLGAQADEEADFWGVGLGFRV